MRILLVMDPGILVPPKGYGGHERLVYMFAREYQNLGNEVHLLVTKGSKIDNCIVHDFGKEGFPPKKINTILAIFSAWIFLFKNRNKFDIIHNFGRLAYLFPVLNRKEKKIMTYGREISNKNISIVNKIPNKNLHFTGCSQDLISRINNVGKWSTVYNAIDFSKYILVKQFSHDKPLIFLGRIERVKGVHNAIRVALLSGSNLVIAGNISPLLEEQIYFKNEVEPYIDGKQIVYVGQLDDNQKNIYLGKSKALLFPIEWNEPFGMVMVEAMSCGTPVIAFKKGSVSEVINEGITGFVVNTVDEMVIAINNISLINREKCREVAEGQFDVKHISKQYLAL